MTKYFIDSEFIEDGKTIDLISIGVVSENGVELYRQSVEFNPKNASEWVRENVFPHLTLCPWIRHRTRESTVEKDLILHKNGQCIDQQRGWIHNCPWRSRIQLRHELLRFINNAPDLPSFYGDYCAYDYVALCQLFGTMMDWPHNWPMYFHDLRQQAHFTNMIDISLRVPMMENEHNAISDARWIRSAWEYLSKAEQEQGA